MVADRPEADGIVSFAADAPEKSDAFDRHAFEALAAIEPSSFWFRERNRVIAWAMQRYFPAAQSLLEVGCGTGSVLAGVRSPAPRG